MPAEQPLARASSLLPARSSFEALTAIFGEKRPPVWPPVSDARNSPPWRAALGARLAVRVRNEESAHRPGTHEPRGATRMTTDERGTRASLVALAATVEGGAAVIGSGSMHPEADGDSQPPGVDALHSGSSRYERNSYRRSSAASSATGSRSGPMLSGLQSSRIGRVSRSSMARACRGTCKPAFRAPNITLTSEASIARRGRTFLPEICTPNSC